METHIYVYIGVYLYKHTPIYTNIYKIICLIDEREKARVTWFESS